MRIRTLDPIGDVQPDREYVLYWMTAFRRVRWNYSLQRAVEWARDLRKPLVVFEPLRCGYRWASDRLHRFVIDGMLDNRLRLNNAAACYFPYLETKAGQGRGLLRALAERACVVVGDDYPAFFLPKMVRAAAEQVSSRFELIDGNGLLPLRAADRVFSRAFDFRRFLQKNLLPHLEEVPEANPLKGSRLPRMDGLPRQITDRWQPAELDDWQSAEGPLADLPIDHAVRPGPLQGGAAAAERTLGTFLQSKLDRYATRRNEPEEDVSSGLSPYLHFGHVSAHQVFANVMERAEWSPDQVADRAKGKSSGWWGTDECTEGFLDELITWRELGYNMAWQQEDYEQYDSLPEWARKTLAEHADDPREQLYSLEQFEQAETHDPLWNAAQRQLLREGRIHNYLRMLWGKKILEWTDSPQDAAEIMIELNNKYALDGRDPNSYSGIYWVLGRYDRAWGPERPIFGKIRYMTSENTARKVRVQGYIERYQELS